MRSRLITLCFVLWAPAVIPAQSRTSPPASSGVTEPFVHEAWTIEDGLPVNSVTALLQSRDGYLWIATFDGLARFDGVRFTVFNTSNSTGLPTNRILELHEFRDGSLWLITNQRQLVRFRDGAFTAFGSAQGISSTVATIIEDHAGTIWVGSGDGLGFIQGDRVVPVARTAIRNRVLALVERSDRSIWAGTDIGEVFRVQGDTATSVVPLSGTPENRVTALYESPAGTLWIATALGTWRYDAPVQRSTLRNVTTFRAAPRTGDVWALSPRGVERFDGAGPTHVSARSPALVADPSGRMVYATGPELHRDGRPIYSLLTSTPGRTGEQLEITALAFDHEGSIWLGTRAGGLHRLKAAFFTVISDAEGLSNKNVYSVYEDRTGAMWIGTLEGFTNRLSNRQITRFDTSAGVPRTALSFLEDRRGRLWIGGGNEQGVRVCAALGPPCGSPTSDPIGRVAVLAMTEDANGDLWFGSDNTEGVFRLRGEAWDRFRNPFREQTGTVRVFAHTRDGALWMGTAGGLVRHREGQFTRISSADGLPFDIIRSLYVDADGWLWIGTEGGGLARLDPREWGDGQRKGRIVSYRAPDGLFDEVIHSILEDDAGRLWMSSNRGIFWVARRELLDFAAGRTTRIHPTGYTERDGLRNREANGGSQPAAIKSRDGRLWFATQDGVAVVDPARIEQNRTPPNVVIEQVLASGVALRAGSGPLELGTSQRTIEIQYTALSFLAPRNMRFRYRLEPYDREWVDAGSRRTAFYTKVPPGHYTFRVRASNNDGVWNEQGAALELRLAPQLWETSAFRLLFVLTLGASLAGTVGWRVRSLRLRARELGRLVDERTRDLRERETRLADQNATLEAQAGQLKELDRAKSRFFANVSHEFRTPLTLTIGPLEDLQADLATRGESPRPLEMALRSSRRLLRLVNQILDVAKLEAGQMKLRARQQDLAGFTRGVAAAFTELALRKRLTFDVIATPNEIQVWFDPDAVEKVLANLLSNAFKFTPDDGRIELRLDSDSAVVRLRVSDTGPGIPADHIPHVFERFYQVDESNARTQPGTGIGLALTKELVELHGGTIVVEHGAADNGHGARFLVTLPLGSGHLRDDQIAEDAPDAVRERSTPAALDGDARDDVVAGVEDRDDVPTLLVVDDSADLRAYIRGHFEHRYRVVEAPDGIDGLERAKALSPDLVISDVMMPGLGGHELCKALKTSAETDFIPIILLTARASTDDRVEGLVGGADDYIAKPFEMRDLEARVDNLIASRRRLRERFGGVQVQLPLSPKETELRPADKTFVERMYATVASRLADPEFGVAELADALFLDRSQLFRRTRELLGETPSDVVRRLRLERATILLSEGAGTVAEVAYGVGFQSVSHFSKAFLDVYGVRPSTFRDRASTRG